MSGARETAPLPSADLEAAYVRHGHSVLRRARWLLGSDQEGREVLHEVFVSLLERPAQFTGKSSLLTFLYASTTHACLNRLRARSTQERLLSQHANLLPATSIPCSPEDALELRRLLHELPEELASVAVYHFLDALTYDDMAAALGCSRRKIAYLLEQLRKRLERMAV